MVDLARRGMTLMVVTMKCGLPAKVATPRDLQRHGRDVEDANKTDFFGKPRATARRSSVADAVALEAMRRTRHSGAMQGPACWPAR